MTDIALCHQPVIQQGGLFLGLFMAGLAGGFTHCTGMCGPFVLSLPAAPGHAPLWKRLSGMELMPYHLGRTTTYASLGFLAALSAGHIQEKLQSSWLSPALLIAGGALFLLQFIGISIMIDVPSLPRMLEKKVTGLARDYTIARGYVLGVLLGFLPCGLLLSALLLAAAAQNPWQGALGMALFGLATMPALNLTGIIKAVLLKHRPHWLLPFRKGLLLASAATLFAIAGVHLT